MADKSSENARSDTSDSESELGNVEAPDVADIIPAARNVPIPTLKILCAAALYKNIIVPTDQATIHILLPLINDAKRYLDSSSLRNVPTTPTRNVSDSTHADEYDYAVKLIVDESVKLEDVSVTVANTDTSDIDRLSISECSAAVYSQSRMQSTGATQITTHAEVHATFNEALSRPTDHVAFRQLSYLDLRMPDTRNTTAVPILQSGFTLHENNSGMDPLQILNVVPKEEKDETQSVENRMSAENDRASAPHSPTVQNPSCEGDIEKEKPASVPHASDILPLEKHVLQENLDVLPARQAESTASTDTVTTHTPSPGRQNVNYSQVKEPILRDCDLNDGTPDTCIKLEPVHSETNNDVIVIDDDDDIVEQSAAKSVVKAETRQEASDSKPDKDHLQSSNEDEHQHDHSIRCVACAKSIPEVDLTIISSDEEKPEAGTSSVPVVKKERKDDQQLDSERLPFRNRLTLSRKRTASPAPGATAKRVKVKSLPTSYFDKSDDEEAGDETVSSLSPYSKQLMGNLLKPKQEVAVITTTHSENSAPVSRHVPKQRGFLVPLLLSERSSVQISAAKASGDTTVSSSTPASTTLSHMNEVAYSAQYSEMLKVNELDQKDIVIKNLKERQQYLEEELENSESNLRHQKEVVAEQAQRMEKYRRHRGRYREKAKENEQELKNLMHKYDELKKIYNDREAKLSSPASTVVTKTEEIEVEIIEIKQSVEGPRLPSKRRSKTHVTDKCTGTDSLPQISSPGTVVTLKKEEKEEQNLKTKESDDIPADLTDVKPATFQEGVEVKNILENESLASFGTPSSQFTLRSISSSNQAVESGTQTEWNEKEEKGSASSTLNVKVQSTQGDGDSANSMQPDDEPLSVGAELTDDETKSTHSKEDSPILKPSIDRSLTSTKSNTENDTKTMTSNSEANKKEKPKMYNVRHQLVTCMSIAGTLQESIQLGINSSTSHSQYAESSEYKALCAMSTKLEEMKETVEKMTENVEKVSDSEDSDSKESTCDEEDTKLDFGTKTGPKTFKSLTALNGEDLLDEEDEFSNDDQFSQLNDDDDRLLDGQEEVDAGEEVESSDLPTTYSSHMQHGQPNEESPSHSSQSSGNTFSRKRRSRGADIEGTHSALEILSPPKVPRIEDAFTDRSIVAKIPRQQQRQRVARMSANPPRALRAKSPEPADKTSPVIPPTKAVAQSQPQRQRVARMSANPPIALRAKSPAPADKTSPVVPPTEPVAQSQPAPQHVFSDVYNRGRKTLGARPSLGSRKSVHPGGLQSLAPTTSGTAKAFKNIPTGYTPPPSSTNSGKDESNSPEPSPVQSPHEKEIPKEDDDDQSDVTSAAENKKKKASPKRKEKAKKTKKKTKTEKKSAPAAPQSSGMNTRKGKKRQAEQGNSGQSSEIQQSVPAKQALTKKTGVLPSKEATDTTQTASAAPPGSSDGENTSQYSLSTELKPLLINHLQGQPMTPEQKMHELKMYSPLSEDLQEIMDLRYTPQDEALMIQALAKFNRRVIANRRGKDSLYYAVVKEIEDYKRADALKRDFYAFVGNSLMTRFYEIIKAYLMNRGVQGMTPNQYWEHMQNENFRPDALTIILLGLFLEINIDLITPTREWNLWDGFPPEIVLGYNGGSNFFPTATIRSRRAKTNKKRRKRLNSSQGKNLENLLSPKVQVIPRDDDYIPNLECFLCDEFQPQDRFEKRVHLAKAHMVKEMYCLICEVDFLETDSLMQHIKDHHEPTVYTCEKCERDFTSKTALHKHIELHEVNLKFLCSLCGKGMRSNVHLKAHLHRHAQHKMNCCCYCKKRFVTKGELKRHINYVHTQKPTFKCELCGNLYKSRENVKKHLNQHHKLGRKLPCPKCPKVFTVTMTYLNHVERVHKLPRKMPMWE